MRSRCAAVLHGSGPTEMPRAAAARACAGSRVPLCPVEVVEGEGDVPFLVEFAGRGASATGGNDAGGGVTVVAFVGGDAFGASVAGGRVAALGARVDWLTGGVEALGGEAVGFFEGSGAGAGAAKDSLMMKHWCRSSTAKPRVHTFQLHLHITLSLPPHRNTHTHTHIIRTLAGWQALVAHHNQPLCVLGR